MMKYKKEHRSRPPVIFPGQKYERLTVIGEGSRDKFGNRKWLCRCECGTEKEYYASQLRKHMIYSCGCYKKELMGNNPRALKRRW